MWKKTFPASAPTRFILKGPKNVEWKGKVWLISISSIAQRKLPQSPVSCCAFVTACGHFRSPEQLAALPATCEKLDSRVEGFQLKVRLVTSFVVCCATEVKVYALETSKLCRFWPFYVKRFWSPPRWTLNFFNQNHVANTRITNFALLRNATSDQQSSHTSEKFFSGFDWCKFW